MSLAQRMHFLKDVFQMTTNTLVSLINQYHNNGLQLFWDNPHVYGWISYVNVHEKEYYKTNK